MTFAKLEDGGSGTSSRRPRVEASLHLVCNACPVLTTMLPGIEPELWPQKNRNRSFHASKTTPKQLQLTTKTTIMLLIDCSIALALLQLCHRASPLGLFRTCSTCLLGAPPTLGTNGTTTNQSDALSLSRVSL